MSYRFIEENTKNVFPSVSFCNIDIAQVPVTLLRGTQWPIFSCGWPGDEARASVDSLVVQEYLGFSVQKWVKAYALKNIPSRDHDELQTKHWCFIHVLMQIYTITCVPMSLNAMGVVLKIHRAAQDSPVGAEAWLFLTYWVTLIFAVERAKPVTMDDKQYFYSVSVFSWWVALKPDLYSLQPLQNCPMGYLGVCLFF